MTRSAERARPFVAAVVRPSSRRGPWVVFTDLDGTLLDAETYDFAPARPALAALRRQRATLVLASSKTRREIELIARRLELRSPLICENGGGILLPRSTGGFRCLALGVPRQQLVRALAEVAQETSTPLTGFSALTAKDVVELTGLPAAEARLALERDFDEPFLAPAGTSLETLRESAGRRGLRIVRGGRFLHLTGNSDKGRAATLLFSHLSRRIDGLRSLGLGDADNDLSLLRAVSRAVVIPDCTGKPAPELRMAIPGAEVAPHPGPRGWNAAVLAVLEGRRLPLVGSLRPSHSTPNDAGGHPDLLTSEEGP